MSTLSVEKKTQISSHVWSSHWQITQFFCAVSRNGLQDMLLHKYSIKKSVWFSNRFLYRPVCAVSRLSISPRSSVVTQQWWLTVVKLFGGGVDRKMATLGSACVHTVCVCGWDGRRLCIRECAHIKVCTTACVDLMCVSVSPHTSVDPLMSASVSVQSTHCAPTKTADLIAFPSAVGMTHAMAWCEAMLLLTPVKPRLLMSHLSTNKLLYTLSYLQ